jgi:hypothetical protein
MPAALKSRGPLDYLSSMKAKQKMSRKQATSQRRRATVGFAEPKSVNAHAGEQKRKVTFGDVTVWGSKITKEQTKVSAEFGQAALKRAADRIVRPGVTIAQRKGVPLYRVDDDNPNVIIRKLDGIEERGIFADGEFKKTR